MWGDYKPQGVHKTLESDFRSMPKRQSQSDRHDRQTDFHTTCHGAVKFTFSNFTTDYLVQVATLFCGHYHRLNGSSSPVLTAICLSYGSLCDFLGFFPQPTWRSHPSTDFDAKWLKRRGFTQGRAFWG